MWAAAAIVAASLVSAYASSQASNKNAKTSSAAQAAANRENVQLAHEQQDWNTWMWEREVLANRENMDHQAALQQASMEQAMAYDTEMSNTAYQRASADMKAAGLNPILAYQQGGASAPTVSPQSVGLPTAHANSSPVARVESTFAPRVSSAAQAASAITSSLQAAADVGLTEQRTRNAEQEQRLTLAQEENTRVNTALQASQAVSEGVRPDLIRAQTRAEQGRPALMGAQTASGYASAREAASRTEGQDLENTRTRNWGPRSAAADAGANLEAVGRRAAPGVRDAARSAYDALPSLPSLSGRSAPGGRHISQGLRRALQ